VEGTVLETRINLGEGIGTKPAPELMMLEGKGIEGDRYFEDATRPKRQVLLIDKATLDDFGYEPGHLREQVLVNLPGLQALAPGTRVGLGEAEVELTMDCAPCLTMAGYSNEEGQSFVNKMMGRRGMLARVTKSGRVAPGDTVMVRG